MSGIPRTGDGQMGGAIGEGSLADEPREGIELMIELTRLNGSLLTVNCDLIRYAEAAPDTLLTLITGEKLVVLEACDVVAEKVLAYRAQVLRSAWPDASGALTARMAWDVRVAHTDED